MMIYAMDTGSDFLGLGIGLAELLIAIIGLGGGSYAGARAAALSRVHLDDRRDLHFKQFPKIKPSIWSDGTQFEIYDALVKTNKTVELLTWTERSMWNRCISKAPEGVLDPVQRMIDNTPRFHPDFLVELDDEFYRPLFEFETYIGLLIRPGSVTRRAKRNALRSREISRKIRRN